MSERQYGIAPSGYALPAGTHVGRVRLQVADLNRSVAYYEQVIGLRVIARSNTAATLGPADATALVELREKRGVTAVPRRGLLGLYHFAILLPNRSALGRFLAHLADSNVQAGMSDHLVSEAVYLTDPDGLGIEVYADRPRSEWRHEGGQLAMTTIPLDVNGVLAAGGGERWTGAPVGTTMGHVHLHVGDLAEAAAFYHEGIGFDKMVWGYPGALFMAADGYHHHLGTNTWAVGAKSASDGDARLLEWTLVVPSPTDAEAVVHNLQLRGFPVAADGDADGDAGWLVRDPWGTAVRIVRGTA